ncbi:unnamed protein product [Rotaria socialis]|uniref:polynucleotide adenylyltransferase n=1 Tax=Rotaria socialis TaxID=392032 RepID=A0A818FNZ4_9BILA|nr:unnamed protein product [Rotaria socialis]
MNSTDDSYSMACSLPSSLEQTPISSLSAASSYSSLVNCDETISIHHDQQQHIERKIKRNDTIPATNNTITQEYTNINKRSPHSTLQNRHVNKLYIRLNGGAASYVLTNDKSFSYTDIDFVFRCDLSSESIWTQIKTIVCECLSQQIPSTSSQLSFSPIIIQAAYVEKIVRVINPSNNDSWALISLYNINGQNIELKFVDRMKRQFQFSVDSFQILIDPLLDYYEQIFKYHQKINKKQQYHNHDYRSSKNNRYLYRYPTISVECLYGSFDVALTHLNRRQIVTISPEGIHGGGLLKYCLLLTRGYRPYDNGISSWQLEKLMCSRFFIDFADINEQEYKLLSYLSSHFSNDDSTKYRYLLQLNTIIERSTVCLMAHERNLTLTLISQLATEYYYRLYDEYNTYQVTTAEVTVPNSITIDVIYHNELDEWKSLYTPSKQQSQLQQEEQK